MKSVCKDGSISTETFFQLPKFTFIEALKGTGELTGTYFLTIFAAYVPVAFVVFAEHVADHKNLSSIIERDLLKDPGLSNTLLGDGIGSMAGAFFGGSPNTLKKCCERALAPAVILKYDVQAVIEIHVKFMELSEVFYMT